MIDTKKLLLLCEILFVKACDIALFRAQAWEVCRQYVTDHIYP